ncbi:AP2M1 [Cordylochernes scorpioides]|uniref:AP2M1 n=1 Tax=Cordylochernes scorpioides TaxID=51811 RepID=A0ABY6KRA8_9ARAC|nr:AP2M1 [Cordylochernes scorpioides]
MIGAIYIFNHKGEQLMVRTYRHDSPPKAGDLFRVKVIHSRQPLRTPILVLHNTSYAHIRRKDIWMAAVSQNNCNIALVFEILNNIAKLMEAYFGCISEDKITENFVLIQQILDEIMDLRSLYITERMNVYTEIMDYGYPQQTDMAALKAVILQQGESSTIASAARAPIVADLTGKISWRAEGIKYRKNEFFLDITEYINVLMSHQGNILSSHIDGKVTLNSTLSGMPQCQFGINDTFSLTKRALTSIPNVCVPRPTQKSVVVDDCHFHQCVELNKFQNDGIVAFTPPDGVCELMRYRITAEVQFPFRVLPMLRELDGNRLEIKVIVKSAFNSSLLAEKLEVIIPTPPHMLEVKHLSWNKGKAKYKPGNNSIHWKWVNLPSCFFINLEFYWLFSFGIVANTRFLWPLEVYGHCWHSC